MIRKTKETFYAYDFSKAKAEIDEYIAEYAPDEEKK